MVSAITVCVCHFDFYKLLKISCLSVYGIRVGNIFGWTVETLIFTDNLISFTDDVFSGVFSSDLISPLPSNQNYAVDCCQNCLP